MATQVEQLVNDNMDWAADVARKAAMALPPSIDVEDLTQVAQIALWQAAQKFDESQGVPFRAFAWQPVRGAIYMSVRRRSYREATHDELPDAITDHRMNPEAAMIRAEEEAEGANLIKWLTQHVHELAPAEAYLVRRAYLDGVEIAELAACWHMETPDMRKRINAAVRSLRRDVREEMAA